MTANDIKTEKNININAYGGNLLHILLKIALVLWLCSNFQTVQWLGLAIWSGLKLVHFQKKWLFSYHITWRETQKLNFLLGRPSFAWKSNA